MEPADKKLDTKIHRIQAILPVKITIVHYRLSRFRNEEHLEVKIIFQTSHTFLIPI